MSARRVEQLEMWHLEVWIAAAAFLLAAVGCARDMEDQPRYEPLEASDFFDDGMSARPRVEGTVARGRLEVSEHFYEGMVDGQLAERLPMEVDQTLLQRGQARYNIFCANCHDRVGTGQGMVVQRGFPQPPSYHEPRLRGVPDGHIYNVITNGLGRMAPYGPYIPPADRWAIVAYVRALQLSQHADLDWLDDQDRSALGKEAP